MGTIGLSSKKHIGYFDFIKAVAYDSSLSEYLLDGKQIARQPESYLVPLLGMRKLALLDGKERFVADRIVESLSESGVTTDRQSLSEREAKKYLMQEAEIDPEMPVNYYDLVVEMLFNLREAEDAGILLLPERIETIDTMASKVVEAIQKDIPKFAHWFVESVYDSLKGYSDNSDSEDFNSGR